MGPFELEEPGSLSEALELLDPEDPAVRPIAGGTALMLMMKSGLYRPQRLVSLRKVVPGLADIRVGPDGALEIGAMVRLSELQRSAVIRDFAPLIAGTLLTHSNVRVRNVATIGGNLAHADPHMDLPPMLIALDARVRATGPAGEREIAVEDLFAAYLETVLANNELITSVVVPAQPPRRAAYIKCTARSADDWPALGIAVSFEIEDGVVRDARIAIGAATETAMRLRQAEALLTVRRLDDALLNEVGRAASAEAPVVADHVPDLHYLEFVLTLYAWDSNSILRRLLCNFGSCDL